MCAYSVDLRQKIVSAYESGRGIFDEIANIFEIRRRIVARFISLARAGESPWPKPHGGGCPAKLSDDTLTHSKLRWGVRCYSASLKSSNKGTERLCYLPS